MNLQVIGIPEAAAELGIEQSSLRRLLIKKHAEGEPIGRKLTERAWVLTEEDMKVLKDRRDGRGKWQQEILADGRTGRQAYEAERRARREAEGPRPS